VNRYILWRIVGNDLPPRHEPDQALKHLGFILEHEPFLPQCEKRFLFNRVVDAARLEQMADMVRAAGHGVDVLPFKPEEYREQRNDPQRFRYLIPINEARNLCLEKGLPTGVEYVLPFDGGCFFHPAGWGSFDAVVRLNPGRPFFVVPMARLGSYEEALDPDLRPSVKEIYRRPNGAQLVGPTEPQVAFGQRADIRFDTNRNYGTVDKAELLWRLGIPGPWDYWEPRVRQQSLQHPSEYSGESMAAGWVARLPSGNPEADGDSLKRGAARAAGVKNLLKRAAHVCGKF